MLMECILAIALHALYIMVMKIKQVLQTHIAVIEPPMEILYMKHGLKKLRMGDKLYYRKVGESSKSQRNSEMRVSRT